MKKLFLLSVAFLLFSFPLQKEAAHADTVSASEIVMDITSERILHKHNENAVLPMASTTKILTAIIIIEDCDLNDVAEVPSEATKAEGSSVYLKEGEHISVIELLYGLMLRSGNDCAVTLAVFHSGSIEKFAETMNERAKLYGASNSHFTNPHGLPDENHRSTAYDLAKITAHAMQNETFRKIVGTQYYRQRNWKNKNKMLVEYEGATGVKTGYTVKAGRCLVSSACRNDMHLVCVVLNSPDMFARSKELLNRSFAEYTPRKIASAQTIYSLKTDVPGKNCEARLKEDVYYPLTERENVKSKVILPQKAYLPVKKDEKIGKIEFYLENQLIFSRDLCIINGAEKSYGDYLKEIVRNFSH